MNTSNRHPTKPAMIVSARKGIQCFFDVDGVTISVWGSAWTGREIVRVDDRVVSNKLSIRFKTVHQFEHLGHQYTVNFIIASVATGLTRIELHRDGELIDFDEARHRSTPFDPATGKFNWRKGWKTIVVSMLAGGLVGALFGYTAATVVGWLV